MSDAKTRAKAVLVVDDDRDGREIVADAIRDTGRTVFTATSAESGLALLDDAAVPRPCLVLLDWRMHPIGARNS